MKSWLRGKRGGAVAFLAIAALLTGGLGWVTGSVLRLEDEQRAARAEAEHKDRLRLALWRLDSFLFPELAKEASRPFSHYSAVYAPWPVFNDRLKPLATGSVLELSPLLQEELPDWMALHFCVGEQTGWWSPQVISGALKTKLHTLDPVSSFRNVTEFRAQLLRDLSAAFSAEALVNLTDRHGQRLFLQPVAPGDSSKGGKEVVVSRGEKGKGNGLPDYADFKTRSGRTSLQGQKYTPPAMQNIATFDGFAHNGEALLAKGATSVGGEAVQVGLMAAVWLPRGLGEERLLFVRPLSLGGKCLTQGIVLDWPRLQQVLAEEVADLFPGARFRPMPEDTVSAPERTLTALPIELLLDPLARSGADLGWTPLRLGLAVAWSACGVALLAVALGGWSLIDFGERRLRFVSAVTHELRTPLTTLRLYLDMLLGGLVREPRQRDEYLRTLTAETDRLHRLISNVLDFSRLENARPKPATATVSIAVVLNGVRETWLPRCREAGKDLSVEIETGAEREVTTDVRLVEQILGNLIDNACKYSRGAADRRILLCACREKPGRLALLVEDFGPGVPTGERRAIFQAFHRGKKTEMVAEGVGLGLALARRWARSLGGRLTVRRGAPAGACFCLELPDAM